MNTINIPEENKSSRLVHLDILRIIAILFVVFNHTGDRGYMLFINRADSPLYLLYMMFSVLCKIAVPIFFMISGALLLSKQETLKQLFVKRILRMIVVLIIVSVPYYFWLHRAEVVTLANFFTYIYGKSASTSLWYLYSYIGLLLLLPFLRSMVKNMKNKDFVYLIVLHIVLVGILPCAEYLLWEGNVTINESFSAVIFTTQNLLYALLGYYLEHVLSEKFYNKKYILCAVLVSIISIFATCGITFYRLSLTSAVDTASAEYFFNSFICIPAMSVYLLAKYFGRRIRNERTKRVFAIFGGAVFGVYLIEKIARALTDCSYTLSVPIVGSFVASLLWCIATCLVSFAVVISIKHIPGVRKIVNKFI